MKTIDVLIADDARPFRIGLRALLEAAEGIRLSAEAIDGMEAVRLAREVQPDVILMDLHMPGMNGIEATRHIMQTSPHIAVLVLTMFDDDDSVFAAMQAGARGYLLKGALKAEILRAIHSAAAGEAIFGPAIARRMIDYFQRMNRDWSDLFPQLTERERQILALLAQHRSNHEIAAELTISTKTVRNYVSSIYDKLQVADRAEAILRAKKEGLV